MGRIFPSTTSSEETTRNSFSSTILTRFAPERRKEEDRVAGAETKTLTGDGEDDDVTSLRSNGERSVKLPQPSEIGDVLPPLVDEKRGEFVGVRVALLLPLSDPGGSPKPESDPESLWALVLWSRYAL